MSTEVFKGKGIRESKDTKIYATRFYGGKDFGQCVQLTIVDSTGRAIYIGMTLTNFKKMATRTINGTAL